MPCIFILVVFLLPICQNRSFFLSFFVFHFHRHRFFIDKLKFIIKITTTRIQTHQTVEVHEFSEMFFFSRKLYRCLFVYLNWRKITFSSLALNLKFKNVEFECIGNSLLLFIFSICQYKLTAWVYIRNYWGMKLVCSPSYSFIFFSSCICLHIDVFFPSTISLSQNSNIYFTRSFQILFHSPVSILDLTVDQTHLKSWIDWTSLTWVCFFRKNFIPSVLVC